MNQNLQIQNTRVGDIECRLVSASSRNYIEIVHWYKNPDYGHESDYIKNGDWYMLLNNPHTRKHKSCFKNPESCYTIATIDIKKEPDVVSVGLRAFELTNKEYKQFRDVVIAAYQSAILMWKEQNNL